MNVSFVGIMVDGTSVTIDAEDEGRAGDVLLSIFKVHAHGRPEMMLKSTVPHWSTAEARRRNDRKILEGAGVATSSVAFLGGSMDGRKVFWR